MTHKTDEITLLSDAANAGMAFSFGDPQPVLSAHQYLDMFQASYNGKYYEPPVNLDAIAKTETANVHHQSALIVKSNILTSCYKGHPLLPRQSFKRLVREFGLFGNCYLERIDNKLGKAMSLKPSPALFTRVGKEGKFFYLHDYGKIHEYKEGAILHLHSIDVRQEIYGVPEWLAAVQSVLLNEGATLFRRKYYVNGSHAGFILYLSDATLSNTDVNKLREEMKQAKGPGNFKNLMLYAPNGKPDGVKVIPVAEVGAKDEFLNIKNVTRDDVLAAHRVPPQLMSILPTNTGGFGSAKNAAVIFNVNELEPLKSTFYEINDWLGEEVIRFDPYELDVEGEGKEK